MIQETSGPETGQLAIHAQNILPILKRWLYSDKEIFLRELIANAVDAITKLKHLALVEGVAIEGAWRVEVRLDPAAGTLTVADNGIGMTSEEVRQYINQVAFSGATEFLKHYQLGDEGQQIIGHFGLGFYSAFMVADRVELRTRSFRAEAEACHWSCEGGLEYQLDPCAKPDRGTEVILHLGAEHREFLEAARVQGILRKYCHFLPVEIALDGQRVNAEGPLWARPSTELADEDYLGFFREAYPDEPDPLFWIHLNVDFPFHLQGILYFPQLRHELDVSKGQIQLYCNQVFVSDHTQELIPRFLTVLQGMIDSPDIPLNVSRSMLQNDPTVRKVASHITRKVADRLAWLFRKDRSRFAAFWQDIHPFVKFGMMEDAKFYDSCRELVLYETSHGEPTTLDEYLERNRERQGDQIFYADTGDAQATYVELFKAQGYEVLRTTSVLDVHFLQFLESKDPKVRWSRVDAAASEHLVDASQRSQVVDGSGKTVETRLQEWFARALGEDAPALEVQPFKSTEVAALITRNEHERRFQEMSAMWQRELQLPERKTLVINSQNPVVQRALLLEDTEQGMELCRHLYDLARLGHDGLKGEELTRFITRSQRLLAQVGAPAETSGAPGA